MGLDLGLERAGFEIRVAVECNRFAVRTIEKNRPKIPVIDRPLEKVTTNEILETAGLKPGEPVLVVGGLCCQSFSTAGQRGSLGDPRGQLINAYLRVVRETRPRFFVIENVRGMLSSAVKHRRLAERGPGFPRLDKDEQLGSGFRHVVTLLKRLGYYTVFDLVNAADFGVPQSRERLLFIGSRDGEDVLMPVPTHAKAAADNLTKWVTLREALRGLREDDPEYIELPPAWRKYMKYIPAGGNWRMIPERLQKAALGSAYVSWGGRSGFYRRLAWDRVSPSLTTPTFKQSHAPLPSDRTPSSERRRVRPYPAVPRQLAARRRHAPEVHPDRQRCPGRVGGGHRPGCTGDDAPTLEAETGRCGVQEPQTHRAAR
jgi:DNA (cytosine-5)-methyltransferase 1